MWAGRRSAHFSDHIPTHRSTGWPSAGARPVPTPKYLPWTTLPRPGPATSTVHAHTDVHALTSHGTSGRTWESAASDGARTRPHDAHAVPAARSMAEHRANAPTLPPAAPHHLRVPRARATQAAADQAAAEQRLGRLRWRRSAASSRARLRALLQLLLRGFLQPPLRPRERHGGFLNHH